MSDVYVYMYKHASMQDKGGLGACFPRKLDALRLLLRPFWDTIIATWLA